MTSRAAIYIRISDPRGDRDDRFGLAVQERACREYADRTGLNVQRVYTDAVTGVTETRVGFGQLLADAGAFTDVVVYAVDRLARHPKAGYALLETLQAAGLQVHTAIEGMLDLEDDAGALNFGVRIVMADAERRRIVRRLTEGKKQKVRGGQPLAPIRAYGYQNGEVYEPEAQWVRWMFQQAASVGTKTIVRDLLRLGIPTRAGTPWNRDTVLKILRNSLYRGEYAYGRDRVTRIPLPDAITCPAPRIVEDELWYAVQRAIDYRSTGAGRRNSRSDLFPLTGRIRCASCGAAMVGAQSRSSQGHRRMNYYYNCGDRALTARNRKGCTHRTYYPASVIHEAVWTALRDLARHPDTLAQTITTPAPMRMDTSKAVADLDAQLVKARNAYLRGIDSEDEYAETKATLTAQRARLLALAEAGEPQGVADTARTQQALVEALSMEDLHPAAARLGLLVKVAPGGELGLTLDPS